MRCRNSRGSLPSQGAFLIRCPYPMLQYRATSLYLYGYQPSDDFVTFSRSEEIGRSLKPKGMIAFVGETSSADGTRSTDGTASVERQPPAMVSATAVVPMATRRRNRLNADI